MNNYQKTEHIIFFFKQYLEGEISEDEKNELFSWIAQSEANRLLFQNILNKERLAQKLDFYLSADDTQDWKVICQKSNIRQSTVHWRRWLQYAAIFAGLTSGTYLYFDRYTPSDTVPIVTEIKPDSIKPGFRQAYIELANGETIQLGDTVNKLEKQLEDVQLKEIGESLVLTTNSTVSKDTQEVAFNKIFVPRGGEYQLILADGTKVWLNSDSKLEFPNNFKGPKRVVRLTGEAYFEVAHNEKVPFQIEVNQIEVLVLGTAFNIYAYENQIRTTLVNGSVEIHSSGNTYQLKPGDQASVLSDQVNIRKVEIDEETGWKNGKFIFREKPLEAVMATLARWYDLDIFYQDPEVKGLHFTGNIPRHSSISDVLKFFKRTHLVDFNIQGHTITVTAGK